ncbi:MAG: peroxide stress protein YaaA [Homoserinimonas sp.]|nr:peroxide stress protein YaaA [Homoserinimonas sp.]
MLVLLPPSETKRDGGAGSSLDLSALSFPELLHARREVLAATRMLADDAATMAEALKLGPSQHGEVLRNRTLAQSPTMPALERYTGVLYDALGASSMSEAERAFAAEHVVIHSALFGLIGAGDHIPAYRLSHNSRLPLAPLKATWREPLSEVLSASRGLVLDLRSEAYVALGAAPEDAYYLRVVAEDDSGRRRALNHFNKKGKGEFVRELIHARIDHADVRSLLVWSDAAGVPLRLGKPGELELLVER